MLSCKDLCKTYKPKKGVPVKALDNVSLTFPDTGMIFLLGKSGSGKSTLLNVLGGLDRCDSGDIIVKGTSTRDFDQSHFDSYRNTYIGFIFQEYNILEEFSVGANVALAIELQSRKATDEDINRILKEVDLEGYGQRRPNELSGGQKQRVAIARALVKNPEIIFADEPTGALDSATGRQVFDTLKKLSHEHLVIVVSHDREFAEGYADRIIELADGRVIDDVSLVARDTAAAEEKAPAGPVYDGDSIIIPANYHLTEEDRLQINAYLAGHEKRITAAKPVSKSGAVFEPTEPGNIVSQKDSGFSLIRSKLPLKSASRIGASALRHKKVRLVFTILLSLVAFTLFALSSTFASYDHIRACTDSIIDSNITYASVIKRQDRLGVGNDYRHWEFKDVTDSVVAQLTEETGLTFTGFYKPDRYRGTMELSPNLGDLAPAAFELMRSSDRYASYATGFVEVDAELIEKMGYTLLAGSLPAENDAASIAVSKYIYDTFAACGYRAAGEETSVKISSPQDLVGKTLIFGENEYTVAGVIDTGFDISRYDFIWRLPVDETDTKDILLRTVGAMELSNELNYSLCAALFTGKGFIKKYIELNAAGAVHAPRMGKYENEYTVSVSGERIARLDEVRDSVIWFDGERTALGDREIVVCAEGMYLTDIYSGTETVEDVEKVAELFAKAGQMDLYYSYNYRETCLEGFTVVGVIPGPDPDDPGYNKKYLYAFAVSDAVFDEMTFPGETVYSCAVAAMPSSESGIRDLVKFCYSTDDGVIYPLQSGATFELDSLNEVFYEISRIFVWVGLFFAVFAAVLFSAFIASSVAYKKQEIGILRAIGSRSADVFRIFFSESFIIAMVNFALSSTASAIIVAVINARIRREGLLVTVLHFGLRQLALLLLISVGVAAIASFLPVRHIASKKPIDAIRNR
ncbi:MAG: ATP-binding cassette domain-containing protein [Clostridia bacterium]|nr:ATP-binding cassette domain-containing protein [Clostridia bacterium]